MRCVTWNEIRRINLHVKWFTIWYRYNEHIYMKDPHFFVNLWINSQELQSKAWFTYNQKLHNYMMVYHQPLNQQHSKHDSVRKMKCLTIRWFRKTKYKKSIFYMKVKTLATFLCSFDLISPHKKYQKFNKTCYHWKESKRRDTMYIKWYLPRRVSFQYLCCPCHLRVFFGTSSMVM